MSPQETYRFRVFISYSSADRPWAEKLSNALERRNIEPFFDRSRLEAGVPWNTQLLGALKNSQHIVVLWSENAKESEWVRQEYTRFDIQISDSVSDQKPSNRRMIFLSLEGTPKIYSDIQMVTDVRDAGAYAKPADQISEDLWERVLNQVHDAITSDDPAIPVPLAVLTTTQERLDKLDLAQKPGFAEEPLDAFLQRIQIGTKANLMQLYGLQQTEWRPFGSQLGIERVLNQLMADINSKFAPEGTQFRWEPVGDKFWSNDLDVVEKEIEKLKGKLPVVVVDPLALYEEEVRKRFELLSQQLENTKVIFMTLLPFATPETHLHLRELIRRLARPLFNRLYEPTFRRNSNRASWYCDMNIGDEMDAKRSLLAALGQHLLDTKKPASPYTEP